MRVLSYFVAASGLGLTLIPAFLVFAGVLDWDTHATLMLAGMLCWFIAAPYLMKGDRDPS